MNRAEKIEEILKRKDYNRILKSNATNIWFNIDFVLDHRSGEELAIKIGNSIGHEVKFVDRKYKNNTSITLRTTYLSIEDGVPRYKNELITPSMKISDGLSLLNDIFDSLIFRNISTDIENGLSSTVEVKFNETFDPVKLLVFSTRDEEYIKRTIGRYTFGRNNGVKNIFKSLSDDRFPHPIRSISGIRDGIEIFKRLFSESAVDIKHSDNKITVKFDMLGGLDYHLKFDKIKKYILNSVNLLEISSTKSLYRKEYKKSLVRLFSYLQKYYDREAL